MIRRLATAPASADQDMLDQLSKWMKTQAYMPSAQEVQVIQEYRGSERRYLAVGLLGGGLFGGVLLWGNPLSRVVGMAVCGGAGLYVGRALHGVEYVSALCALPDSRISATLRQYAMERQLETRYNL